MKQDIEKLFTPLTLIVNVIRRYCKDLTVT